MWKVSRSKSFNQGLNFNQRAEYASSHSVGRSSPLRLLRLTLACTLPVRSTSGFPTFSRTVTTAAATAAAAILAEAEDTELVQAAQGGGFKLLGAHQRCVDG
jgi:hypothetical protein